MLFKLTRHGICTQLLECHYRNRRNRRNRRTRRTPKPAIISPSAISAHCPSVGTGVTAAASNLTDTVQTSVSGAVV